MAASEAAPSEMLVAGTVGPVLSPSASPIPLSVLHQVGRLRESDLAFDGVMRQISVVSHENEKALYVTRSEKGQP